MWGQNDNKSGSQLKNQLTYQVFMVWEMVVFDLCYKKNGPFCKDPPFYFWLGHQKTLCYDLDLNE